MVHRDPRIRWWHELGMFAAVLGGFTVVLHVLNIAWKEPADTVTLRLICSGPREICEKAGRVALDGQFAALRAGGWTVKDGD